MMSSKATSAVWASCPSGSPCCGLSRFGFLSGTAPSLVALLGLCAEAEPSGATSATRYEQSERIVYVSCVVTELEFIDVQRQIGSADLVEIADDAALDERPETFDVLSMNRTDDIVAFGVVDDFMRIAWRQTAITKPLIGYQQGHFLGYGLAYKALQGSAIDALNYASGNFALAADRANDWSFAGPDTTCSATLEPLALVAVLGEAAHESFIDLYLAEQLAFGAVLHCDADAMAHIPSRFVGAGPDHPVDLMGAHALFRVVHQEGDLEPLDKRVFRVLEDGPGDDGEAIAVLVAALAKPMEGAGLNLPYLRIAASRAMDTIGPTTLGEKCLAVFFGLKPGDKFAEVHHAREYNASFGWCQVPDNRPN